VFQPHWKLDGGLRRRLLDDPVIGDAFQEFLHHDGDLQARHMDTEAEVLAVPEGQQPLDGPVPDEFVGVGVFAFVVGRRRRAGRSPADRAAV
jgi:hypothetical protein